MTPTTDLAFLEELAVWYLKEHGLYEDGWRIVWDNSKTHAGICRYHGKKIGLSKFYATHRSWEETENTILHEIAHALVGLGHGHSPVWKAKAVEVGATPEACFVAGADVPKGKYEAVCPGCGKRELAYRWRLKEAMKNARHTTCGTTLPVKWIEVAA